VGKRGYVLWDIHVSILNIGSGLIIEEGSENLRCKLTAENIVQCYTKILRIRL
jgi:hypothetical protein